MPDNTVTLKIEGVVPLRSFALAIGRLDALIHALAHKHARDIKWIIADLQPGSASTTVAGIGDIQRVLDVVDAYEEIGHALERGAPLHYPIRIAQPAEKIRRFIGNGIESVTFETARRDYVVRAAAAGESGGGAPPAGPDTPRSISTSRILPPAYGAVSGQVETLARRGSLRFTLYDTLHNKAVSCYLAEGHEDTMRDIWGHYATVEGIVTREPETGRALSVRQITRVAKQETHPGSYRDARGASPYAEVPPEDLIRRVRDGWRSS